MNTQQTPAQALDSLLRQAGDPPREYGPVPFYWWNGAPLSKERLAWQLDRLREKGVAGVNVNYIHAPDGGVEPGEPAYFSGEWWELWRWFVDECARRGMGAGFDDYLVTFSAKGKVGNRLLEGDPTLRGMSLRCRQARCTAENPAVLAAEGPILCCRAYRLREGGVAGEGVDIAGSFGEGCLRWAPAEGEWLAVLVYGARENNLDPLNPALAQGTIREYFEPFREAAPSQMGRGVDYFFQDELNFRMPQPYWHGRLPGEFQRAKGYDLIPLLPALWTDIGTQTEKVCLDFADVLVTMLEESYFIPIYRWTRENGLLYGCDQSSRGFPKHSHELYVDYFRTMRWFSAPGADDPLAMPRRRLVSGKVASSIAHLNRRPRAWVEGYHSTGWGITPSEFIAYTNQNFLMGYNLINLHGLYYSTAGGWFEWAPPDFHFRQPYWRHMDRFNGYCTRLSFLLTRGVHRCDAAVLYPTSAYQARLAGDREEELFVSLCDTLFYNGLDFDCIDDTAVAQSQIGDGCLSVAGEMYRAVILPSMEAVRYSTAVRLLEFRRMGGVVLACGCAPHASDRAGRDDPVLDAVVEELLGGAEIGYGALAEDPGEVLAILNRTLDRDFVCDVPDVSVLHRHTEGVDLYTVGNQSDRARTVSCRFRDQRRPFVMDALHNQLFDAGECNHTDGCTGLRLFLGPYALRILIFADALPGRPLLPAQTGEPPRAVRSLDGAWTCRPEPLLDNRWGDFRLPATPGMIGPEGRRFRWSRSPAPGWQQPDFNDENWRREAYTYGPRMLRLGPVQAEAAGPELDAELAALTDCPDDGVLSAGERTYRWEPYCYSERWGIEKDPLLMHWQTGPHGLKGKVPDEFIDVTAGNPGDTVYLWSQVVAPKDGEYELVAGSRSAYRVYLDGRPVLEQERALPAAVILPFRLPDYAPREQRVTLPLCRGVHRLLIRCVQSEGQRLRLYAVLRPLESPADGGSGDAGGPVLRWFIPGGALSYSAEPVDTQSPVYYRFFSPPGLVSMDIPLRGSLAETWIGGHRASTEELPPEDGQRILRVYPAAGSGMSTASVALSVVPEAGFTGGAVFAGPVRFHCGEGRIEPGDWTLSGLDTYSGGLWYERTVTLTDADLENRIRLNLGDVRATAEIVVNGQPAGILLTPPWSCDVTEHLRAGDNSLRILVANTLANHYDCEIPTGYVYEGQTVSGLLGPVRLEFCAKP